MDGEYAPEAPWYDVEHGLSRSENGNHSREMPGTGSGQAVMHAGSDIIESSGASTRSWRHRIRPDAAIIRVGVAHDDLCEAVVGLGPRVLRPRTNGIRPGVSCNAVDGCESDGMGAVFPRAVWATGSGAPTSRRFPVYINLFLLIDVFLVANIERFCLITHFRYCA